MLRKLTTGFKNLFTWFPVIWDDRQWDYHFIYKLLQKKLELMEDEFRSDRVYTANADVVSDDLEKVRLALKRLSEGNYLTYALKEYDEKYGENDELFHVDEEGFLQFTQDEEQVKMFEEAGKLADKHVQQDREFVFEYMKDNIEKWWD